MTQLPLSLPWPLIVIDFEASGLGPETFPIEVGIACWRDRAADIQTWSTLIKPTEEWSANRPWLEEAEGIHSISRAELSSGLDVKTVMHELNAQIGDHFAFCDGAQDDVRWLWHLSQAARIAPSFRLADWDALTGTLPRAGYATLIRHLEGQRIEHRAGSDARRLLVALKAASECLSR